MTGVLVVSRDVSTSPETSHDVERWIDTFHRLQDMLQAGATTCFRDGKINQEHEYKQQKYFMSGGPSLDRA